MVNQPAEEKKRRINPDLVCSLVLVIIGILFFYDFLFSSKNFYFRDILTFHYPLRKVLIDAYARGELPLWNPFVLFGQPMLANPNYMAFYPTNLFHLFLPFNYAFKLHFIIHPILAGLGAYFLQRRIGIRALPALTGSLAYEFSGAVLSFLNLYNIVPAVALLPWMGWAFRGALQGRWLRRSLMLGTLLALQAIAFEPLMFQCDLWLLLGLAVLHWVESDDRAQALRRIIRVGAVSAVFGLGLAAAQVIPTLELLPLSARSSLPLTEVSLWSLHPLDLINVAIPNMFGKYYSFDLTNYWGEGIHEGRQGYLVSFFLGSGTLLLTALSYASRRKKTILVFWGLALVGLSMALGKYNLVNTWLYQHIPLFSLGRYPSKYFLLCALALCVLAALGVETLFEKEDEPAKKRKRVALCGLMMGVALIGCWFYFSIHSEILQTWMLQVSGNLNAGKNFPWMIGQLRTSVISSGIFLTTLSLVLLAAPPRKGGMVWKALIPCILMAELIPANLRLSPLISDADVSFVPEVNRYVKQLIPGELYRVAPPMTLASSQSLSRVSLHAPNDSSVWTILFHKMIGQPLYGITEGIQYSLDRPVDHLNTMESEKLCATCSNLPDAACLSLCAKVNSPVILSVPKLKDPRLAAIASFKTGSDYPINVYWLDKTVTRASFASGYDFAETHEEALNRFLDPDFPAGTTVILEGRGGQKIGQPLQGSAKVLKYQNNRVLCSVDAKAPGYLVLLDSHYPGWIAYVDGKEETVLRANYTFRAVSVSAGTHQVEFVFRPKSVYWGLTISSVFLLLGLSLAVFVRRKP